MGTFFYPEDGSDTFLRNVGSHKICMAPHPRRRHSSSFLFFTVCHKDMFITSWISFFLNILAKCGKILNSKTFAVAQCTFSPIHASSEVVLYFSTA
jgi:hypothetical protein